MQYPAPVIFLWKSLKNLILLNSGVHTAHIPPPINAEMFIVEIACFLDLETAAVFMFFCKEATLLIDLDN